jgi:NADH-quinone oxidoreductase subunit N
VIAVERRNRSGDLISDYRGLASSNPVLAAAMTFFMLSLTGVPPLAGFVGKFYVLSAATNAGLIWLVVIAVINSAISAYYYIGVIVAMYAQEGGAPVERMTAHPGLLISIAIAVAGTILIGLLPQPYMSAAVNAFAAAVGHPSYATATAMLP